MTFSDRLAPAFVAACSLVVLCIAAWLTPSPTGFGTHEQIRFRSGIGMRPCTWLAIAGRPCPTCGMTTAFAHAANGNLLTALHAQPLGAVLALATSVAFWTGLHSAVTGSRLGAIVARALGRRSLWVLLGAMLAAWSYKILTWPVM